MPGRRRNKTRVLKIAMFADGRVMVDGKRSTAEMMERSLQRFARKEGRVWLYRDNLHEQPPTAMKGIPEALARLGLPVQLFRDADFATADMTIDHEQFFLGRGPRPSAEELQQQAERDLEEIRGLGLVDRAIQDFIERVPNVQVENMQISYFGSTDVVWCYVSYGREGTEESHQKGFGYQRQTSGEWTLEWPEKKIYPVTPLPSFRRLGTFRLSSPKVVVTDPGYDEEAARIEGLGCFVAPCATGMWRASIAKDSIPDRKWKMPRAVLMVHERSRAPSAESPEWRRIGDAGGDSGLIGAYDFAHFHDDAVVPKDQKWTFYGGRPAVAKELWYSFICELIQKKIAVVGPYGVTVGWDGGMNVDTYSVGGKVVAIRLSISGWPNEM